MLRHNDIQPLDMENRVGGSPCDCVPDNGYVLPVDTGAQGQALDPYDRLSKFLDLIAGIVARATAPGHKSDAPDKSCSAEAAAEQE